MRHMMLRCSNKKLFASRHAIRHERNTTTTLTRNFSAHTYPSNYFDILIVGGGMVGAALACALGSTKMTSLLKIGVLDSLPLGNDVKLTELPDLRVYSLSHATVDLFKAIGVWKEMEDARVTPYRSMHVWDSTGNGNINFRAADYQLDNLGYIVEHNIITSVLHQRLRKLNVEVLAPLAIEEIGQQDEEKDKKADGTNFGKMSSRKDNDGLMTVKTKSGDTFTTKLLVGADGAQSVVRKALSLPISGWSYGQKAVVQVVSLQQPNSSAWQRFLPSGPIALLPLFDNYSSIVWSTSTQHADHLLTLSDQEFASELCKAFMAPVSTMCNGMGYGSKFNPLSPPTNIPPTIESVCGKRAAFPLKRSHVDEYAYQRVALVGDAAHTIHPLAGQGVNLGFGDVVSLTNNIISAVYTGQDFGQRSSLRMYASTRREENERMMSGINLINNLFTSPLLVPTVVRNLSLSFTDSLSPLKKVFVDMALGKGNNLAWIGSSV
eukprot:TRINITY_DN5439_c0_g1_i1.p1 TRINITY_DN5439_c0_g1~~TRINITY_DN5439_c0_g1_i1.p1  ORF type:complete len:492 (+),score=97.96 TRINITY_DN5439_c0_g1_i1:47-1522(+)